MKTLFLLLIAFFSIQTDLVTTRVNVHSAVVSRHDKSQKNLEIGLEHRRAGRWETAIKPFQKALALNPKLAVAQHYSGVV